LSGLTSLANEVWAMVMHLQPRGALAGAKPRWSLKSAYLSCLSCALVPARGHLLRERSGGPPCPLSRPARGVLCGQRRCHGEHRPRAGAYAAAGSCARAPSVWT